MVCAVSTPLTATAVAGEDEMTTKLKIGQRITSGIGDDQETGVVDSIDGGYVVVTGSVSIGVASA